MSPLHGTTPLPFPAPVGPRSQRRGERFELPALASSVAVARGRVGSHTNAWGLPDTVRDTAQLIVSELFTNALLHTDSHQVICRLECAGALLRIEVADEGAGPARPEPRSPDPGAEHGRGLMLLDALASQWGVISFEHGGCTVWAEITS
ncbi:ATP-binding protein [Streptomyces sp. PT12]|uniref:ATP-binding protein n=1 Tax=Streptomyces sp. PT12 TaxID=1510197 RepID=UPI000DE24897|nr:ATP-binding protein [Streptomyces sp. PT12]RBM04719.1 ATP-binding protein [Streptomyces sp. PT12]